MLPGDAAQLWNWLGILARTESFRSDAKELLRARLDEHEDLRHAVQLHALYAARARATIWLSEIDLSRRMLGLSGRPGDVTWFLDRLANSDNKDPALREEWRDLMRLGIGQGGLDPGLRAASRKFQAIDQQLEAFAHKLENPPKPHWQRKQERQAEKREKKRRIANEVSRRYFAANQNMLRAGELAAIVQPAQAYLGEFSDLEREQPPTNRIVQWLGNNLAADAMAGLEAVLHRSDLPSPGDVAKGFAEGTTWNYCYAIMAGLLARQRAGIGLADLASDVRVTGLLLCLNDGGLCRDDDLATLCESLERSVIPTANDRRDFARTWVEPSLAAGTLHIPGLYKLAHDPHWQATGITLAPGWLTTFRKIPEHIELQLVDCLTHSSTGLASLALIASARVDVVYDDVDHLFGWLAIDVLVRFDMVLPDLSGIGSQHPEFIWFLRDRFQLERRGALLPVSVAQAKWTVTQFRTQWPHAVLRGSGSGNKNSYDATDFLLAMISRIANDTSVEANKAMQRLIDGSSDSYSDLIRHMAAEQRQKRAEEDFAPLPPKDLGDLLTEGPPSNVDDLKSLVLEELAVAQKILIGDDVDQVRDFWSDVGIPYLENRCRDRLAAMIGPELMRYGVQRITEADMPKTKRADLAFACGQLQLPMEVKGQWHRDVWKAATDQLDLKYLIDWRSEQRGIYCVLWFGKLSSTSGRRLRAAPGGVKAPSSANEMRTMLIERIPEAQRALIDVVVLDFAAGRP